MAEAMRSTLLVGDHGQIVRSYLQTHDARLYVAVHEPEAPDVDLLVCPPLLYDAVANYRREVALAQAGMSQESPVGVRTCRFQYRGCGNSRGNVSESLAALVTDAERVVTHLDLGAQRPLVVLGTRGSAFVARRIADEHSANLVLWAPPESGRDYLVSVYRDLAIYNIGKCEPVEFAEEILGYSFPSSLQADLNGCPSPFDGLVERRDSRQAAITNTLVIQRSDPNRKELYRPSAESFELLQLGFDLPWLHDPPSWTDARSAEAREFLTTSTLNWIERWA